MTSIDPVIELLQDALSPLGVVTARRMFGGHGIYLDGQIFALLDDGALFFKVADDNRPAFAAEGMKPFSYVTKKGPGALHSYWRVPERLFDEPDELREWARLAIAASRSAAVKKRPRPSDPSRRRSL